MCRIIDKHGYPEEHEIDTIRSWDITDGSALSLVYFIQRMWAYADYGYFKLADTPEGYEVQMSTAGWSGNESIIEALQESLFWMLYWRMSKRGGHYTFFIPRVEK